MGIASRMLESKFEAVARSMSENFGVKVLSGGPQFMTDGKTIVIPPFPEEADAEVEVMFKGGLDHETAHVIYSDFDALKKAIGDPMEKDPEKLEISPKMKDLANMIEDIRIEKLMSDAYYGCAQNIEDLNRLTVKRNMDGVGVSKFRDLALAMRAQATGGPVTRYTKDPDVVAVFEDLQDLVVEIPKVASTQEAIDLAVKIYKRIYDEDPEMAKEDSSGGAGSGGGKKEKRKVKRSELIAAGVEEVEGMPGMGGEEIEIEEDVPGYEPKGKNSGKEGEEGEGEGEGEKGEESDGSGEGKGEGEGEESDDSSKSNGIVSASSPRDVDEEAELYKEVEKFIEGPAGAPSGEHFCQRAKKQFRKNEKSEKGLDLNREMQEEVLARLYKPPKKNYGRVMEKKEHFPHPQAVKKDKEEKVKNDHRDLEKYLHEYELIAPHVAMLQSKLLQVLQAKAVRRFIPDQEHGRLDPKRLTRIFVGRKTAQQQTKVFRQKSPMVTVNTAVEILIDQSGSMGGTKIRTARQTAMILAEALARLNIPYEVTGFTTNDHYAAYEMGRKEGEKGTEHIWNRWEGLHHRIFKSFEEPHERTKTRMAQVESYYNNVDNESVLWAAKRLAKRREERKIMFVFSDGMPACSSSDDRILNYQLKKNVQRIEAAGIEVVGIGMLTEAPKHFYKNHVVINRIEDFPIEVFKLLSRMLLTRAKAA